MLIASLAGAAMFTMVEMIVIMQVLVLMCLIKLMVGQSTCSHNRNERAGHGYRKAAERGLSQNS